MAFSVKTIKRFIDALTSVLAGDEFALAIQNRSQLSPKTFKRLVTAMNSKLVAQDIQDAILGLRPLSKEDLTYMKSGFASALTAADVASSVAGGILPGAADVLKLDVPVVPAPVAAPVVSVPSGTYSTAQTVSLTSPIPGAVLYYTTDGSTPTEASPVYSSPISVAASMTIKILAVKVGLTDSLTSISYVIPTPVATPTFSPVAGSYVGLQSVTVSSATSGATFYYTTDGSTPTVASTLYSGPISVGASETLNVLAVKAGFTDSAVGSAAYVITI